MIRRYYEEEMRYLHEAGKVFAETHPEQARYLNVDSIADRDPYVERLFEGFAFLAGRIREQLDDELPQYTESLCKLLYPHFIKPIPACSIVEFKPKMGEVQGATLLKKGTEVRSAPAGEERAVCRFVTTQDVRLLPLSLGEAELSWAADGTTSVSLTFQLEGGADYQSLQLSPLRLHFNAAPTVASLMHLFFTRHVTKVVFRRGKDHPDQAFNENDSVTLYGQQWVRPGGLAEEEGLLPYGANAFTGFRLLQEYFAFRRKFWCIDLFGFERYRPASSSATFQVDIFFDRSYPDDQRFKGENIRLFCSPVVNLFEMDAEPIRVDHQTFEYRVVAGTRYRKSIQVYDVLRGVGMEEKTGHRHEYLPFFSFEHTKTDDQRYFTSTSRIGATDRYETYIALDSAEDVDNLVTESLSLDLRCTNGSLPREKLQERMINQLAPDVPKIAQPTNLTVPTLILYPPTKRRKDFFWRMISHWSFNYQTLASREAFAGLLALYDWTDTDANPRRIAGLRNVTWASKEMMYRGGVLRGAEITLQIQEGHFADEGDVCLFGLVMSTFFSMYATLNSFVHLTIEMMPSGKRYQWQPKKGTRPIL